jgi:hypothetical protein
MQLVLLALLLAMVPLSVMGAAFNFGRMQGLDLTKEDFYKEIISTSTPIKTILATYNPVFNAYIPYVIERAATEPHISRLKEILAYPNLVLTVTAWPRPENFVMDHLTLAHTYKAILRKRGYGYMEDLSAARLLIDFILENLADIPKDILKEIVSDLAHFTQFPGRQHLYEKIQHLDGAALEFLSPMLALHQSDFSDPKDLGIQIIHALDFPSYKKDLPRVFDKAKGFKREIHADEFKDFIRYAAARYDDPERFETMLSIARDNGFVPDEDDMTFCMQVAILGKSLALVEHMKKKYGLSLLDFLDDVRGALLVDALKELGNITPLMDRLSLYSKKLSYELEQQYSFDSLTLLLHSPVANWYFRGFSAVLDGTYLKHILEAPNDFSKMLVLSSIASRPIRGYSGRALSHHGYYHLLVQLILKGHGDYVKNLLFDKGLLESLLGSDLELIRFAVLVGARASGPDIETFLRPEVFNRLPAHLKYTIYKGLKKRGLESYLRNTADRATKSFFRAVVKIAYEMYVDDSSLVFAAYPEMFSLIKHDLPHLRRLIPMK